MVSIRIACMFTHKDHRLTCANIVYNDHVTCIIEFNAHVKCSIATYSVRAECPARMTGHDTHWQKSDALKHSTTQEALLDLPADFVGRQQLS